MTMRADPVSRQQVIEWLAVALGRDAGKDFGEVGVGIDASQLARFDEAGDGSPVFSAEIVACEQAFLRWKAMGRIERSTGLLSRSIRPPPRKRISPAQ